MSGHLDAGQYGRCVKAIQIRRPWTPRDRPGGRRQRLLNDEQRWVEWRPRVVASAVNKHHLDVLDRRAGGQTASATAVATAESVVCPKLHCLRHRRVQKQTVNADVVQAQQCRPTAVKGACKATKLH